MSSAKRPIYRKEIEKGCTCSHNSELLIVFHLNRVSVFDSLLLNRIRVLRTLAAHTYPKLIGSTPGGGGV